MKEAACVGVTAGASAPDILVQNVIARLREFGGGEAVTLEGAKKILFSKCRKSCVWMFVRSNKISQFRNLPDDATLTRS